MGQYHLTVNLDKKEYLNPHTLGCGLKLWEHIANHPGVGAALIVLLAASNGRGGGDFRCDDPNGIIGRWAGDRIAIVGDYGELSDLADEHGADTIYTRCGVDSLESALDTYAENYHEQYRAKLEGKPFFVDISDKVATIIEHELGGYYVGNGWRDWKDNG